MRRSAGAGISSAPAERSRTQARRGRMPAGSAPRLRREAVSPIVEARGRGISSAPAERSGRALQASRDSRDQLRACGEKDVPRHGDSTSAGSAPRLRREVATQATSGR